MSDQGRVLVLSMGGTIGMRRSAEGTLVPDAVVADLLTWVPELRSCAEIQVEVLADLDSSQMRPEHWLLLARRIEAAESEGGWRGLVVLHGTDTMAYTASAIAFLLPALTLPVVFTGGQKPLTATRTDARNNLIGAVETALYGPVEVMIFFNNKAFRAVRATKATIEGFEGFVSPNFRVLGTAGIQWQWRRSRFWPKAQRPSIWAALPSELPIAPLVLTWVPGLSVASVSRLMEDQWAVILEGFGAGHLPLDDDLRALIRDYLASGRLLFIRSQVFQGQTQLGNYASGKELLDLGPQTTGDQTLEALVTKLMVLKSHGLTNARLLTLMQKSLVGEMTEAD